VVKKAKGGGSKGRASRVTIDARAKASATASAKYEIKKNIQQVIPEDVTRARAGAWLTLISPLTQWAGLKGDELAHKREMLRLQREETLSEIARRADARLKDLPAPQEPIPTKFLVPYLEKASLEDADSELIDLWVNLLVSAARHYNPHYVHFANIIAQMSAQQAKLFAKIAGAEEDISLDSAIDVMNSEFFHNFMEEHLAYVFKHAEPSPQNIGEMWHLIEENVNTVGIEIQHIELEDITKPLEAPDSHRSGTIQGSGYDDKLQTDFAILDAIRIVRYLDTGFFNLGDRWKIKVMFYYVTPLGKGFAYACGIAK
jgi:hypothetical protein